MFRAVAKHRHGGTQRHHYRGEYPLNPSSPKKFPHLPATKITRSPPTTEELKGVFDELNVASDRAAGILAAAHLEVAFEGLLEAHFITLSADEKEFLFGSQGVLSAAVAKVRLAHALGFIGIYTRDACGAIFLIRNMLAHAPRSVTFSTNAIKNKCDNLDLIEAYKNSGLIDECDYNSTREKYIITIYLIVLQIAKLKNEQNKNKLKSYTSILAEILEKFRDIPRDQKSLSKDLAELIEEAKIDRAPIP
jgi:hypothetical protein